MTKKGANICSKRRVFLKEAFCLALGSFFYSKSQALASMRGIAFWKKFSPPLPKGDNWIFRNSLSASTWGTSASVYALNWNGSQFLAVGGNGAAGGGGKVAISSDGINWTDQTSLRVTGWGVTGDVQAAVWTGSQYVVAGQSSKCATSPDGVTWTNQPALAATSFGAGGCRALIWTGSVLMAGGANGRLATSTDGASWTYVGGLNSIWGSVNVLALVATGTGYVAFGNNGVTGGYVATSPDGVTWTNRTTLQATAWGTRIARYVIWTGSQIVLVGDANYVALSSDGASWVARNELNTLIPSGAVWGCCWTGEKIVVVTTGGKCATSPDAITWTEQTTFATAWGVAQAYAVVMGNNILVAGGASGKIATST